MERDIFTGEQESFGRAVRSYIAEKVVPVYRQWELAGEVPRLFFRDMGDLGAMGMAIPPEYGGGGSRDYRYNVMLQEECCRALVTPGSLRTQLDIILPYFLAYADEAQRERWFPRLATGELLTAIAMTEPDTGSDLAGVRTRAVREGDEYVINGTKTFITGGWLADLVIVVARTSTDESDRRAGLSLIVVEDGMPGFVKTGKLDKLGLKAQDTAELSFQDVRVPVANRLGEEGRAFSYLGRNLAQERLAIAVGSVAQARAAHRLTVDYVKQRKTFGRLLSEYQNTKFELAAMTAEIAAGQALLDQSVLAHVAGRLDAPDAAATKLYCTEMQGRVVDRCLQLFGGYGYITEFPISRLYADARVSRIYGGTSEVMKMIISRSLGL